MKTLNFRINKIVIVLTITTIVFLGGCTRMSETVSNKSAGMNGSFEVTKSGLPVNWLLYTQKTAKKGDFDLIIDNSEYKDGKQSLKFLVRECSATGGWHSPGFCNEFKAIPGETYRVSFWVKNDGCEFFIQIGGVSAFKGQYETIAKSEEKIDTWKYFEYDYKMPKEKGFKRIRFEMNILSPGSFWIDDIKIVGIDGKGVQPAAY